MASWGGLGRGLLKGSLIGAGAGVGLGVNPWLGMGITGLAGKVRAPIRGGDKPDSKSIAKEEAAAKRAVKPSDDFHSAILQIDKTLLANYKVSLKNNAGILRIQQMLAGPGAARAKEMRMESGIGGAPPIIMLPGGAGGKGDDGKGGFPWWMIPMISMIIGGVVSGTPPMPGRRGRAPPGKFITKWNIKSLEIKMLERFNAMEKLWKVPTGTGRGSGLEYLRQHTDRLFERLKGEFWGSRSRGGPKGGTRGLSLLERFGDRLFGRMRAEFWGARFPGGGAVSGTGRTGPGKGFFGGMEDRLVERLRSELLPRTPTGGGRGSGLEYLDRFGERLFERMRTEFLGTRFPGSGAATGTGSGRSTAKGFGGLLERFGDRLFGRMRAEFWGARFPGGGAVSGTGRQGPGKGFFGGMESRFVEKFVELNKSIEALEKIFERPAGEGPFRGRPHETWVEAFERMNRNFAGMVEILTGDKTAGPNRARFRILPGKGFMGLMETRIVGTVKSVGFGLGTGVARILNRIIGIENFLKIPAAKPIDYAKMKPAANWRLAWIGAGNKPAFSDLIKFNEKANRFQARQTIDMLTRPAGSTGSAMGTSTSGKTIKAGQFVSGVDADKIKASGGGRTARAALADKLSFMKMSGAASRIKGLLKSVTIKLPIINKRITVNPGPIYGNFLKGFKAAATITALPGWMRKPVAIALMCLIAFAVIWKFFRFVVGDYGTPGSAAAWAGLGIDMAKFGTYLVAIGLTWVMIQAALQLIFGLMLTAVSVAQVWNPIGWVTGPLTFALGWWGSDYLVHYVGVKWGFISEAEPKNPEGEAEVTWKQIQAAAYQQLLQEGNPAAAALAVGNMSQVKTSLSKAYTKSSDTLKSISTSAAATIMNTVIPTAGASATFGQTMESAGIRPVQSARDTYKIKDMAMWLSGERGDSPLGKGGILTTLTTTSGIKYRVATRFAAQFAGFVAELESTGYNIRTISDKRETKIRNTKWSFHTLGMAIDINHTQNPDDYYLRSPIGTRTRKGHTNTINGKKYKVWNPKDKSQMNLPLDVGIMAKKYGLGWGGNWSYQWGQGELLQYKDPMHFSAAKGELGASPIKSQKTGQALTQALLESGWVVPVGTGADKQYYSIPMGVSAFMEGGNLPEIPPAVFRTLPKHIQDQITRYKTLQSSALQQGGNGAINVDNSAPVAVVYNEGPSMSYMEHIDLGAALASDYTDIPNTGPEGQRRAWS